MKRLSYYCILLFVLCVSFCSTIKIKSSGHIDRLQLDDIIPVNPTITFGQLDNGLRYFIRVNHKPENRAELRLAVNAGSIMEDNDQQGLAHFCEHMAFNGTRNFKKQELVDYLESIGMSFGPDINAYTSFDETVYMLEVPTDSINILKNAFQVLEDWAHLVSYEDEEIDKERGVLIEEWRLGRGAEARMRDKQFPILFQGSRYANRLPIGKKEVIDTCQYETLRRFYKDWYRPDLMSIIAVGDFDPVFIEKHIKKHFSSFSNPVDEEERRIFPVPDHNETLFAIARDPEATRTRVSIYFKHELQAEKTVADYRRILIENCYNTMMNERLRELTKESDPPFLYGYSDVGRLVRSKEVYFLGAGVKELGIERGLDALLTEAERVKKFGFTRTELNRVQKEMLRNIERAYKERDKTESRHYAAEYIRHFLHGEPIPGIEYEYQLFNKYIPGIKVDEINQLADKMITEDNRVILVNGPQKENIPIPKEEQLLSVIESVKQKIIEPYIDQVSDEPFITELPVSGKIIRENKLDSINITEWWLSNGVKVILKPTDFKNDEIRFSAFSHGGNSLIPEEQFISALTATSIVMEGGIGRFKQIEMEKKLAGKTVMVQPYIGTLSEGMSGMASPEDVETLFELIYLYFIQPRKDSTAFLSYRTRMKGFIENRSAQPETAFNDTIQVTLAQYHHRARPWTEELLDEMNLEESFNIYQDRFADAGDFIFIFLGNFDIESIKPLILTYLGSLPSINRNETWQDIGLLPPAGVIKKTVKTGIEPKSRVRLIFTGPYQWSRQNNYIMTSMISGLQIKLRKIIREELGGAYRISINSSESHFPREEYSVNIEFGCAPERVEELTQAVFTQIDSIKSYSLDMETILKVKESQIRNHEVNLKENRFWLTSLINAYYHKLDPLDILHYTDLVDNLTQELIQGAAQKYFNTDNYIRVVLLPGDME
jgi:zinc protease